MKRIILTCLIVFTIQTLVNSQTIKFRKVIGNNGYESGYSAKQTFDKGFIIGGATSSFGEGNSDMYLVKTDSMGIPRYHKTFGGINVDQGRCIRQTSDSGYVLLGYTNSFGTGGYDFYLIKTDSALNTQWTKTYGGTDWDFGNCVEQTSDGGFILCGSTYSYGKGDADYYLIKTNSLGDTLWTRTYGGLKEDVAKSVLQTLDGGYVLTGTTKSMGDSLGDFYTIKTNATGDTTWTNKYGGTYLDYGNDIVESQFGGFIVGGETQSYSYIPGSSDGIIQQISAAGITGNTYSTGFSSPQFDNIESVTEAPNGDIGMIGRDVTYGDAGGNGDVRFFQIRSDWYYRGATTYGFNGFETGYSVEPTSDQGYIICGYTNSFNNYLNDIYLIKTDSNGVAGVTDNSIVISVAELFSSKSSDLLVYPNPAKTSVSIYSEKLNGEAILKLYDVLGNEYKSEKIYISQKEKLSIDISDLARGMYILNISNKDVNYSQKLIVQD